MCLYYGIDNETNNSVNSTRLKPFALLPPAAKLADHSIRIKHVMQIWVDADACPRVIKDILYRAAKRGEVMTLFVANQTLNLPKSPWLKSIQVPGG